MSNDSTPPTFHAPIWDRGEAIDAEMLAFTIGDDWLQDRRLVQVDIEGSLAHADGLLRAKLLETADHAAIRAGLLELKESHARGEWNVESSDEDVHSAVERRLIARIGDAGKRLHTGRSRNDQVAVDMRLWLRGAVRDQGQALETLQAALQTFIQQHGAEAIPGYTHMRRAMPSTLSDWAGAYLSAFGHDLADLDHVSARLRHCPLGSGAGYGVPLPLDRDGVAHSLGFTGPEEPVTATQHSRGRAELAYLTALESIALDLGKLAADLWLFTTKEFAFASLPVELTTGSSLMPHKRNPDILELLRAHAAQVSTDRSALLQVLQGLPSGYHRDFQLLKPPLFRAHDRLAALLPLAAKILTGLTWHKEALQTAASDPALLATQRALDRARAGEPFRDAYRSESHS